MIRRHLPIVLAAAALLATLSTILFGLLSSQSASSNAPIMDTDGDGCADLEELGSNPELGGARRPSSPWDYYDQDGNGTIDLFRDIYGVASAYGQGPGGPDYSTQKDRSAAPPGMDVWDMGPPNGVVDLFSDVFGVAFQYGHTCDGKADLPETLSFLTGTQSMDELEQLITQDFAPILQAQMAAGQGGSGMAAGQTFPGGYTVVCVYPDGSIAVAPPVTPEATPIPAPQNDSDVPEGEEVQSGQAC